MSTLLHGLGLLAGAVLVYAVLRDAFETAVLPRRPSQRHRFTRLFYRLTWPPVRTLARRSPGLAGDTALNYFGPMWILGLIGVWAGLLVVAWSLLYWGLGSHIRVAGTVGPAYLWDLYTSGTTLFTLGMGDVSPNSLPTRVVVVLEAGLGLGLFALVIGYVPVLYAAFSRREVLVSLLDARAGSPPTAAEFIRRNLEPGRPEPLLDSLAEFERWAAELLESYLSYPVLMFYRSQHDRQSWLAAMVAVTDTCAVLLATGDPRFARQAGFTFGIMRHAIVDLAPYLGIAAHGHESDRLTARAQALLLEALRLAEVETLDQARFNQRLGMLRGSYEPLAEAMADWLLMPLPPLAPETASPDDWQTEADD